MSQVFVRSDQLKDVVFDVKLRIPEWKVLFAVDGEKDAEQLAAFLDLPESDVSTTLEKLRTMQLVAAGDVAGEPEGNGGDAAPSEAEATVAVAPEPEPEPEPDSAEDTPDFPIMPEEEVEADTPQPEMADAPEPVADDGAGDEDDDDLDDLIGNLLEEDDAREAAGADPDLDDLETPAAGDDDFDLGGLFDEEEKETESALSDMIGALDDAEEPEAAVADEPEEAPAPEETAAPETPAAPAGKPGTGTILVVDDSVVIRKMVEIALENENYEIVSVATGKDALNYLDDNDPDLIILDIMLSDVNGLDVLKAIKASKQIPVVMLSAKDTPRETTKAKQLGADDFIPKPFKDEELVSKIKELVKS